MKEKHLYILAGVFAFLLIIYFVSKPRQTAVNLDEFVQNIVIGVSEDDIKKIEVYKETDTEQRTEMIFAKQEDQWYIPTHFTAKAQNSRISQLISDILEMTGKVRSSDPSFFDTYKIADEQGVHLILKDVADKPLANVIIGKRAEDAGSGFIRFAGKEKVYSVDKNLLSSLSVNGNVDTLTCFKGKSFVDLQAVNQDRNELTLIGLIVDRKETIIKKVEREVEVMNDDSTTSTKTETEWVLMKGEKEIRLEKQEVNKFIRDVTNIRGQEVIDRIGNTLGDLNKNSRYGLNRPRNYIVFKKS